MDEIIEMLEERHTPLEIVEILYSLDKFDIDIMLLVMIYAPVCLENWLCVGIKNRPDFGDSCL